MDQDEQARALEAIRRRNQLIGLYETDNPQHPEYDSGVPADAGVPSMMADPAEAIRRAAVINRMRAIADNGQPTGQAAGQPMVMPPKPMPYEVEPGKQPAPTVGHDNKRQKAKEIPVDPMVEYDAMLEALARKREAYRQAALSVRGGDVLGGATLNPFDSTAFDDRK